jgi:isoquinoline 1-oxidoreductase beta subunit
MSLTRRGFVGATAGGLVLGFALPLKQSRILLAAAPAEVQLNAFLRIGTDDSVTVLINHSEMGQGIWTGLPMLVAEELEADWTRIRVEHAPANPIYAHKLFGGQGTGGSTSTWTELDRFRQAGATARAMLIAAAARRWRVAPETLRAENGHVVNGSERLPYGKLAAAAAKLAPPESVPLKDPKDWKIIGKSTKRLDGPDKITGRAQYGMDVKARLIATIARAPTFGGKVRSFKADAALKVAGVKKVVEVPTGVAVIATNSWAAMKGREALEIDWDPGPNGDLDSEKIAAGYRELSQKPGVVAAQAGDAAAGLQTAVKRLEVVYEVPYLAHAPMEPLNATVRIGRGECEVWSGTQLQGWDQKNVAQILGIKLEKVQIHTPFLGGGFGRRGTFNSDFISEGVHVARAAGATVKTIWTREDDIKGGFYRPLFVHRIEVGVDGKGLPVAWRHTIVGQGLFTDKNGIDSAAIEGASDSPYLTSVPARLVTLHVPQLGVPVHFWRSVGNTHTAFAMETVMDELAAAARLDPLELRRALIKDSPRHLRVLDAVADKAGWGKPAPSGITRGLAVHASFGSFVAQVAEVSVDQGKVRVHRVVSAIDCGPVVNPDAVQAQVMSAVVFGLSAALHGTITLKDGKVQESNFDDYPIVRLPDAPRTETVIVASTDKMGGVGEPATPPVAPAVGNALFAATGKRLRSLPFKIA